VLCSLEIYVKDIALVAFAPNLKALLRPASFYFSPISRRTTFWYFCNTFGAMEKELYFVLVTDGHDLSLQNFQDTMGDIQIVFYLI